MKKTLFLVSLGLMAFALSPAPAEAAGGNLKPLGKFGYWSAYQMAEGTNPVCYMSISAKPPEKKGAKTKRGNVVLMITHRPAESSLDVISYSAGTKFKAASDVTVQAGGKSFSLFTQDDTAWSRDAATDRAVSQALRTSDSVTILGTASSGMQIADTVSLKGAPEAYYAMSKACGVAAPSPKKEAPVKKDEAKKKPAKK